MQASFCAYIYLTLPFLLFASFIVPSIVDFHRMMNSPGRSRFHVLMFTGANTDCVLDLKKSVQTRILARRTGSLQLII